MIIVIIDMHGKRFGMQAARASSVRLMFSSVFIKADYLPRSKPNTSHPTMRQPMAHHSEKVTDAPAPSSGTFSRVLSSTSGQSFKRDYGSG